MTRLRNRVHPAIEKIVEQRVDVLAMSVSHFFLRERVADALVFSDLINVRIDTQLVERAAEEHHVGRQSVDEQIAGRRNDNFVARRGDVVFLVQTKLEIRVDRLAGRTKVSDRVADLFGFAPTHA